MQRRVTKLPKCVTVPFPSLHYTASWRRVLWGLGVCGKFPHGRGKDLFYLKYLSQGLAKLWRGHFTRQPHTRRQETVVPLVLSPIFLLWLQVMQSCEGGRSCLGSVIPWAMPAPSPAQPGRAPRDSCWAKCGWLARTAKEQRRGSAYVVYLCYSEMFPCHWDRKQLWTEISAYDGNVRSVMLFHIIFKAWLSANWHMYMLAL